MTTGKMRRYEMLERVQAFGDAHRALFPDGTVGGQAFAAVAAAVQQLAGYNQTRLSAARRGQRAKTIARRALIAQLRDVARTAAAITGVTPGFPESFRVPEQQSDASWLELARVFVRDAEPVQAAFVAHNMPPTFLDDLRQAVGAFERAIDDLKAGVEAHAAANAGLDAAFASADQAVDTLDVVVRNALKPDAAAMGAWQRARSVGRSHRSKTTVPAPAPTVVAPMPRPVASAVSDDHAADEARERKAS